MPSESKLEFSNKVVSFQCSGPSMEPTLYTNNVLLTERISRRLNRLDRGDIIVAKCPTKPQQNICKRIVGMPGDKIHIKPRINFNPFANSKSVVITVEESSDDIYQDTIDDETDIEELSDDEKLLHLNNQELKSRRFHSKVIYVPRGHVWLEGDNYENSSDSRNYGPVPIGLIQSRIMIRLWPISDIKLFL